MTNPTVFQSRVEIAVLPLEDATLDDIENFLSDTDWIVDPEPGAVGILYRVGDENIHSGLNTVLTRDLSLVRVAGTFVQALTLDTINRIYSN